MLDCHGCDFFYMLTTEQLLFVHVSLNGCNFRCLLLENFEVLLILWNDRKKRKTWDKFQLQINFNYPIVAPTFNFPTIFFLQSSPCFSIFFPSPNIFSLSSEELAILFIYHSMKISRFLNFFCLPSYPEFILIEVLFSIFVFNTFSQTLMLSIEYQTNAFSFDTRKYEKDTHLWLVVGLWGIMHNKSTAWWCWMNSGDTPIISDITATSNRKFQEKPRKKWNVDKAEKSINCVPSKCVIG